MRAVTRTEVEQRPSFPILDSLRAVGALAVLTTHTSFQAGSYVHNGVWGTVLSRLDVGVAIFFVLSGFLLARPYLAGAHARLPRPATGRYYWKRLLRVYPVYVVTAVVALVLIPDNGRLGAWEWLRTLTLTDTYAVDRLPQGLTQMWSLAVEVSFYLLLPWLMLVATGRRGGLPVRRVVVLLAVLVGTSVWWHLHLAPILAQRVPGIPTTWLPAYATWFAVGIALALAHVAYQASSPTSRLRRGCEVLGSMPGTCWALVGGLLLVVATPLAGPGLLFPATPAQGFFKHLVYAVIGGLIVLTGVFADPGGRYARALSFPFLRHLGLISYSIFCIHLPVLYAVMNLGPFRLFGGHGLAIWAITLTITLVCSELLYRLVELPGMRLRSLGKRQGTVGSEPSRKPRATTTR